ncbi:hypothetical protein [Microbulbifer epialgicus]|uniref:Sugar phosphate isomerase/epimerase n=1 Tax=Microbulbifer epialgicus TaxID=393907 RepID=A0ABV4NTH3_9GAMM
MKLHAATAMFPGDSYDSALSKLASNKVIDAGQSVSIAHVQLCPQNHGKLSIEGLNLLKTRFNDSQFRLHATCRLSVNGYRRYDASTPFEASRSYFQEMSELSKFVNAPAYSLHSGRRSESTLESMISNVFYIQDLFDCPVAVEGLYPAKGNRLLVSTWEEYKKLMLSGVFYALDMSHLNIVATKERYWDLELLVELLSHPHCIEVHISGNNGYADKHEPIFVETLPAWWQFMDHVGPNAVIFTESNQYMYSKKGVGQ